MERTLNEFMLIRLPRQDGTMYIYLGGDIDLYTIPKISTEFLDILRYVEEGDRLIVHLGKAEVRLQDEPERLMSEITFCDEDCVALMISMWKALKKKGCEIILVIPDPIIREAFTKRGLTETLSIVSNVFGNRGGVIHTQQAAECCSFCATTIQGCGFYNSRN